MKKREKNIVYRRLIRSYLSSIISISMVLLLAGLVGVLVVNAKSVSTYFRENIKISIILEEGVTDQEVIKMIDHLHQIDYVKKLDHISQERGTKEMEELLGSDFLSLFETNPIPQSIDIFLKGEYVSIDSLTLVERRLSSLENVREVLYQQSLVELINDNMEKATLVLGAIVLILAFISFVLIGNTVRLNLYAKRFVINTMKLVGAKRSFIRKPLLIKGIWQGLISGVIADILLFILLYYLTKDLPELYQLFDLNLVALLFIAVPLLGVLLCLLSTFFIANRLISMNSDDIYY